MPSLRISYFHPRMCWLPFYVLVLLLAACTSGTGSTPRPVFTEHCLQVGGKLESAVSITAPSNGVLRLRIVERGVSVSASLNGDPKSTSESPVERLGTLLLVSDTRAGQSHTVTVRAEDSPDITGEVCINVDLLAAGDASEKAFAAAGRATHEHDWTAAFDGFLDAARRYDAIGASNSAGESRQALAELAYLRLDKKRDSYALAAQALTDYSKQGAEARPLQIAGLADLQGKALLDMPGLDIKDVAPRIDALQAVARKYYGAEPAGARELPRVDIMAAFLQYRLNEFTRARDIFAQAAQVCRAGRDWDCYAIASQDVAGLEFEGKNYTAALSTFAEALSSLPAGLDPKLAGDIWNNYGTLQGMMGLFSDSERSLATAMREFAQIGDCQGVRRNLSRSGNLLAQLGSLSDAMHSLQQSVSLDCSGLLATAATPAAVRGTEPRRPAVAWCEDALDPANLAIENKLIIFNSLVSLGDTLILQGDSNEAERCLRTAGPYASSAQARMRLANARGEMLLEHRDAAGASASFNDSIRIAKSAEISPAHQLYGAARLGSVKSSLLAGDAATAVRDGMTVLEASVQRGDIDQTVAALRLLAEGYRELNQQDRAARTLETAVSLIEAVPIDELDGEKRATYLATQYQVFAELTDLYASEAEADPSMAALAFATSERGRARSLRYAVTQAQRDTLSPGPLPLSRYKSLLHDVADWSAKQTGGTQSDLVAGLDAMARNRSHPEEPFDHLQLTRTLGQLDATLVEYAAGTHNMFAFIVTGDAVKVVRLGERGRIAGAAADLHDRLLDAEAPRSEVAGTARTLGELVLQPLSAHLSTRRLIIVPDEGLHTVPFNVLPWSDRAGDSLLRHAEVSIEPSALFLTQVRPEGPQHIAAPRVELLGDPVFRLSDWRHECTDAISDQTTASTARTVSDWTESLPRLPGSRTEVQMVARLSQQSRPGSHVEMLLGCAAVPAALRRAAGGHVDLLHIATHARVDSQRPRLSALALTPERREDGPASAFGLLDILGLKLSSSLVVLSACETSRGRLLPGEGVLGPAQAFLQAGAGAVVASYWRVDDQTTSKFMQGFYRYLLAEHLPAATALRRAQLDAAETSPSHDWAAFSLYGWPDSSL